ncbi:MAG: PaaI family thioesterase [Acidimicrobiales bacterium]
MSNPSAAERRPPVTPFIDPFANITVDTERGGAPYARFLELFRTLQDTVVGSNPPEGLWDEVSAHLETVIDLLAPWAAPEWQRPAGMRVDLPGRGNPLLIPFVWDDESEGHVRGRVMFRPFHLGGNGAAHGGTLPLLFDDVLGRLANSVGGTIGRTAYLLVNYRKITPIGVELQVEGSVDRIEGRKRWVSARLLDQGTLIADAEALFVELLPGQP